MIAQQHLASDMRQLADGIHTTLASWPVMDSQDAPFAAMQESAAILLDAAAQLERPEGNDDE